jgi:hypothetical protein
MPPDNPIDDALHYVYRIDRPGAASLASPAPRTDPGWAAGERGGS